MLPRTAHFLLLFAVGLIHADEAAKKKEAPARLTDSCTQLLVAVPENWQSTRATLQLFHRKDAASPWQAQWKSPIPVLLGKNGLAWGRGELPVPQGNQKIPNKVEKDGKAPAGCFKIGKLHGYATKPPQGTKLAYNQVTAADCWVDDPKHPSYNRHLEIDLKNPPPWYEKQRMRLGDYAYEWLLEIAHNFAPTQAGAGSAIFFHIRRGPEKPSVGCTTMAKPDLLKLIAALDPARQPHYVLLPASEYTARAKTWGLPSHTGE